MVFVLFIRPVLRTPLKRKILDVCGLGLDMNKLLLLILMLFLVLHTLLMMLHTLLMVVVFVLLTPHFFFRLVRLILFLVN